MYSCQNARNIPPSAPLILWKWPTKPFQRTHVDLCQKGNDYYLVVIDSHSKWIELQQMKSTTTEWTINGLHLILATRGLFEEVVSDNGPQFTSTKFAEFLRKNVTLSPSPSTTGMPPAELMVQSRLRKRLKLSLIWHTF